MKKLLMASTLIFLPFLLCAEAGIGIKAGYQQSQDSERDFAYSKTEVPAFAGLEFLIQTAASEDNENLFGIKIGAEANGENKYDSYEYLGGSNYLYGTTKSYAFKVPVTIYYKYAPSNSIVNFWIGAGATYAYTMRELDFSGYISPYSVWGNVKSNSSKIFPHIKGGIGFRFTRVFELGLDAGYNFAAKVEDKDLGGGIDLTGFETSVAARFYF